MRGHHEEICYTKHGYPPGYVPRKASNNSLVQAHNVVKGGDEGYIGESESHTSSATFTQDQVNQLLQVIPRNTNGDVHANMAEMTILLSRNNQDASCILDIGATNHMTHNEHWLTKLQKADNAIFQLPNGKFYNLESIGNYKFMDNKSLNNVLHVPDFKFNLLSISKLARDLSCAVIFLPKFVTS